MKNRRPPVGVELPRQHVGWFGTSTRRISTVRFDASRVTQTVLADLKCNIREFREIGEKHFDAVYHLAVRAIKAGGDMEILCKGLIELDIAEVTYKEAALISRCLDFRSRELMEREQRIELGITRARWRYGAPCMLEPGEPTPSDLLQDAAHKEADGKIYNIAEGMMLNGKRTWPGRALGCKCSSKAIIK